MVWLLLLLISNVLLYIPLTAAYGQASSWSPLGGIVNLNVEGRMSAFFLNHKLHPFRLCAEWTLLMIMLAKWPLTGRAGKVMPALATFAYTGLLLFQIYYAGMHWIYGETPSFRNEWALVREVLPVFIAGHGLSYPLAYLAVMISFVLIYGLLYGLVVRILRSGEPAFSSPTGPWAGWGLAAYILVSLSRYPDAGTDDLRLNSQWLVPRVVAGWQKTAEGSLDHLEARSQIYSIWMNDSLAHRPNVYLIFLESYGAVPFLSAYIRDSFGVAVHQFERELRDTGWYPASIYSLAPIKGGRSWLSFTSAMTGVRIADQLGYNHLFTLDYDYPHLIRYLNKEGYITHRINTMQTNSQTDSLIPYAAIESFHEFGDWTLYPDIPYTGYQFNPMGGIPDQYAFEYVWSRQIQGHPEPHFVFFITLDNHAPWYPPPPVAETFTDLDTLTRPPNGVIWDLGADIMDRYLADVLYEWRWISRFIRSRAEPDALFILVGDHQPPAMEAQISDMINDYAVPLHVISRDEALIRSLTGHGFCEGLVPQVSDPVSWRHEGIYSLIRGLLVQGDSTRLHPPARFLPGGI